MRSLTDGARLPKPHRPWPCGGAFVLPLPGQGADRVRRDLHAFDGRHLDRQTELARADRSQPTTRISASGRTSGILSVLVNGEGNVSLKGTMRDGRSQSAIWSSKVTSRDEQSIVNMTFEAGKVRDLKVIEPPPEADRVPIVEAHKNSVIDPLSAFLIPAAAGDPLQASACRRDLNIFDGRRRYDISLTFRRLDKATPEKGYNGPALVCAARLSPISGHRASSPLVKYHRRRTRHRSLVRADRRHAAACAGQTLGRQRHRQHGAARRSVRDRACTRIRQITGISEDAASSGMNDGRRISP